MPRPNERLGPLWGGVLLLALFYVYYSGMAPLSPNDGSHFALVQALVKDHSFCIDRRVASTAYVDYSVHAGHYYSDRAPGTALAAALFVLSGLSWHMWPAVAGVLAALCAYLIARRWASPWAALLSATAVALGTTVWRYAHYLFSHTPAACLVLASIYLALRLGDRERQPRWVAPLFGWVTAFAFVTEYQLLVLTPLVGAYVLGARWGQGRWRGLRDLWPAAVTWALGAGLLAFYQWRCFGSPWHTSYAYRPGWVEGYAWSGDLRQGLYGLLVGSGMVRGLFTLSPVVWLSLVGYLLLCRRRAAEVALCLGSFAALLMVTAGHVSWNGATTGDTRYITAIAPLPFLALGVWVDRYLTVPRAPLGRFLSEGLFYYLLLFTIGFNGHGLFHRYHVGQTIGSPVGLIVGSFDPSEVFFGLLAGTRFDQVFWCFVGFGATASLVTWILGLRVARKE